MSAWSARRGISRSIGKEKKEKKKEKKKRKKNILNPRVLLLRHTISYLLTDYKSGVTFRLHKNEEVAVLIPLWLFFSRPVFSIK